jgi:hypothetical protein
MSIGIDATFSNTDSEQTTTGLTHTATDSSQDTLSKIKRAIATFQQNVTNQATQNLATQNQQTGSSGTSSQGTTGSSNQQTTGSNNSVTTTGSSQEAINEAKANLATARGNYDNAEVNTQPIVDNIIRKAAIDFAPARVAQNKAGLYNTSTLQSLQAESEGAAASDAAAVVLNYKTSQQQLASQISGQLLDATKTSSTAGTTSSGTSGTSTSNTDGTNSQAGFSNTQSATAGTTVGSGTTVGTQNEDDQVNSIVKMLSTTVSDSKTQTEGNSQTEGVKAGASWSIICTELTRQNKLTARERLANYKTFASYPKWGIAGYYVWATPVVAHIHNHPFGRLAAVLTKVFKARARGNKFANFTIELPSAVCGLYLLLVEKFSAKNGEVNG